MMINDIGQVYRVETNGSGKHYPGVVASDIGVGRDGTVWVISDKKLPGGFALCRLDWKTGKWIELPEPAAAVKVAVL